MRAVSLKPVYRGGNVYGKTNLCEKKNKLNAKIIAGLEAISLKKFLIFSKWSS